MNECTEMLNHVEDIRDTLIVLAIVTGATLGAVLSKVFIK